MAPKENRGSEDDNVIRFDFRDELKKQRGKQRRKAWILGLGAFSIVFAGGMLALNWPTLGSSSLTSSELTPKFSLVAERSEEHTSELQSLMRISYAVFTLQKTNTTH